MEKNFGEITQSWENSLEIILNDKKTCMRSYGDSVISAT